MKKYYAGIGARATPLEFLDKMTHYAGILEDLGYILRSGGAQGADQAFEDGVKNKENLEIFTPKMLENTQKYDNFYEIAAKYALCDDNIFKKWKLYVQKLFARNMMIILGPGNNEKVDFVACWSPVDDYADASGGTPHGIRCALDHEIPVFNFYHREDEASFIKFLKDLINDKRV